MSATIKKLEKGMVEIEVEVAFDDIKKELENAARTLTEKKPLPGFRPGKASYDTVKNAYGEMAIYETALPNIIRKHYVTAVTENHVHTYGEPKIEVTKLAPNNPIAFKAVVAAVPNVTSMPDWKSIKVEAKEVKVEDAKVEETIKEVQRMQTKEVKVEREAKEGDKLVVDMDLSVGGVPLEGGQAKNHGVYLDDNYYIPGMKEKVIGMKAEDKRDFTLKFPEDHFQKSIAGKEVHVSVVAKEVYELQNPPIDDELAKSLGQETLEKLRTLIRENMLTEAKQKEDQRIEIEILEQLVSKAKFDDVPEVVLNDEVKRMIDELQHGVADQGMQWTDYLTNIKKTEDELKLEMAPQAVKRIKTAVVIREIGEKEVVETDDAELLAEVAKLMNRYTGNAAAQEQLRSEDYQEYLRASLRNRKVLAMIRESATKK